MRESAGVTANDLLQVAAYVAALILLTPPLGAFMARVFAGERTFLTPVLGPLERVTYRLIGIDPTREMTWRGYTLALCVFNALGFFLLLAILLGQGALPLNPRHFAGLSLPLAFNTAVSFMTNTNWQAYSGEAQLSYFSQMIGLTFQNFVSAATGIAALLALARGFARRSTNTLGNFWADLVRGVLYVLLPLSIVLALVLVSQGVVQNFSDYSTAKTLEGAEQVIPMGPAASQIAIKQLGTNGGGFFGVNSAHPFENPTPLTNFLEMLAILMLPAALCYTFGKTVGNTRQGWVIFAAMMALFLAGFALSWWAESQPNPITHVPVNMEGKEQRFGVMNSVLWSTATTGASNGSVNAMHDSLSPLAGGVAMFNIMLGEVIFGGVGCGLYGMLMYVLVTVFIAGLMVGRTPEYLGKKIEAYEMRLAIIVLIVPSALILVGAAVACMFPPALASLANNGPHGLSEILYAFSSASGNNGSAFAGLTVDTPFYDYALGVAMLVGRFICLVPVLAIGGSLARKKIAPPSSGTFPTDGALFVVLLLGIILVVGALTHLPALTLGPVVEHMLMLQGRTF
jgi:K+-transporting ATPase ATPase A chain